MQQKSTSKNARWCMLSTTRAASYVKFMSTAARHLCPFMTGLRKAALDNTKMVCDVTPGLRPDNLLWDWECRDCVSTPYIRRHTKGAISWQGGQGRRAKEPAEEEKGQGHFFCYYRREPFDRLGARGVEARLTRKGAQSRRVQQHDYADNMLTMSVIIDMMLPHSASSLVPRWKTHMG